MKTASLARIPFVVHDRPRWEEAREGAEHRAPPPQPHDDAEPHHVPVQGWGSPERLAAARQALDGLLAHVEAHRGGALLERVAAQMRGLRAAKRSDACVLYAARHLCEGFWRRPVVAEYVARRLVDAELFKAWKLVDLLRYGRTPLEVSESFLRASGTVDGHRAPDHDVLVTRHAPWRASAGGSATSGHLVVLVPGLGETGRDFHEEVDQLTHHGHEVVALDAPWAGQTRAPAAPDGPPQADAAALVRDLAWAVHHLATRSAPGVRLVLLGQGAGGTAVLALLLAQAAAAVPWRLPDALDAVLQAPYLGPTPRLGNHLALALSRLPLLGRLEASPWLPAAAASKAARAQIALCRQREAVRLSFALLLQLQRQAAAVWAAWHAGQRPGGRLVVVHSADDPWANPACSHRLGQPGGQGHAATVRILRGADHALCHVPAQRLEAVWALRRLLASYERP